MIAEPASVTQQLGRLHCLRGIAALGVFYHHLGQFSSTALGSSYGLPGSGLLWTGVDLFFVLSGFLMMWTTGQKPGGARESLSFLLTRSARIYPMYWVTLLGTFLLAALFPGALPDGPQCDLLCQVTLLPEQDEFLIGPAWTLSFEMAFYVLFAALVLLPPQGRIRALAVWTLLVCTLGGLITTQVMLVHHIYTPLVLEFLAGIWIAVLIRRGVRLQGWVILIAAGVLLLSGAALFNAVSPSLPSGGAEWARVALCGGPASVIIWRLASQDTTAPLTPNRFMGKLGDDSYAIYLVHWPIIVVGSTIAPSWGIPTGMQFAAYLAMCLIGTFFLSGLLTKYIGFPTQKFAKLVTTHLKS